MYQFTGYDRLFKAHTAARLALRCFPTVVGATVFALFTLGTPNLADAQSTPLVGNHPASVGTTLHAHAAATRSLKLHLIFAPRNPASLAKLLDDLQNPASPNFHRWLSSAQFNAKFGRTPGEVAAVRQWLAAQGFRVVGSSARGIISVATVAQAESTFKTSVMASADGAAFANASDPQVPASLAAIIGSIEGLDNLRHSLAAALRPPGSLGAVTAQALPRSSQIRQAKPESRNTNGGILLTAAVADYSGGFGIAFGPADLWTFYDETPLLNAGTDGGGGDCVAVVEDTDYYSPSVTLFDTNFSLPAASITRVMASGTNPGRTSDEVEALLDIEWVHAVAPGAAIRVYIGDGASAAVDPLVDAMQRAVTDNACGAISVSYGYCGASAAFFNTTLDSIFAQAAAQGQSVFISSGDQGAADIVINGAGTACVVGSARHVSEMASDPHVIAVGGSAFTPTYDVSHNDLGSTAERVWNDSTGAGGGGASAVFGKPAWQVAGTPADAKRDIPDVALGSSPISPGFYWGDDTGLAGQAAMNCCVGGTSIAAPMWAGLAKLIAQSTGGRLGNMNPRIYALGALHDASVSGLRDVTLGNNNFSGVSGFAAVAGYDQSTGWGSADMAALTAAYPVSTATPTPSPTPTPTTTPTATPSSTPTATPAPTPTASPTATPTPASTPTSTPTPTPTATPSPTANPATWSPRTVLFGPHKVGTFTVPKMISIGNPLKSTAALIIGSISMTSGNFVVDSATTTCVSGASIARGAHCRVGVRFAPSVQGLLAGSLIVTDSSSNGPHVVALHGRGM